MTGEQSVVAIVMEAKRMFIQEEAANELADAIPLTSTTDTLRVKLLSIPHVTQAPIRQALG